MVGSRSLPIHPEAGIDSFIEVPARINECRILSMSHKNIPRGAINRLWSDPSLTGLFGGVAPPVAINVRDMVVNTYMKANGETSGRN